MSESSDRLRSQILESILEKIDRIDVAVHDVSIDQAVMASDLKQLSDAVRGMKRDHEKRVTVLENDRIRAKAWIAAAGVFGGCIVAAVSFLLRIIGV